MANIYKSKYTGAQIDEAIGKVATNEQEITNIKTGYIPLKQFTSGPYQIPQIGYNKELNWIDCNVSISAQSIVQRDGNGIIYINPPDKAPENVNEYAAVNVGYANKTYVKAINVTGNTYVYAASSEGPNGRLKVSPTVEGGIVVQTTADATVRTNDPKNVYDAVNLQYLNKKLASNEIIKDPVKSYFLWNTNTVNFNDTFASDATVDWGDGTVEPYTPDMGAPSHTYTDGNTYHLISISNLITIPKGMFSNNDGLIKVYFGSSLMVISDYAFQACHNLNEVILLSEECLQGGIGEQSFSETSLTSFTLPWHCGSISSQAFKAVSLMTIISHSSSVVTIASDSFEPGMKIIVPKDSVAAYQAATGWSNFADMIGYEIESSTDIASTPSGVLMKENYVGVRGTTSKLGFKNINGNTYITQGNLAGTVEMKISMPSALYGSTQELVSKQGLKTINGNSIVGTGDITISGGGDVTLAGNNTFTGSNKFNKHITLIYGPEGYVDFGNNNKFYGYCWIQGSNNHQLSVPTITKNETMALKSDIPDTSSFVKNNNSDSFIVEDISGMKGTLAYNSLTIEYPQYLNYGKSSSTLNYLGLNNTLMSSDGKVTLHNTTLAFENNGNTTTVTIPNKTGTVALTSDIKIKSATLSGTTLDITLG